MKLEEHIEQHLSDGSLSEERLSPSLLADDEILDEPRDLLLKLEVDEAYVEDNNDNKDETEVHFENDPTENENKEVKFLKI